MKNINTDIDIRIDKNLISELDKQVELSQNNEIRVTKKLLLNMGLMFIFKEIPVIEIKEKIKQYPKSANKKRIAFRMNNPSIIEQFNTTATKNEKHILIEMALHNIFGKLNSKPVTDLIIDYIKLGGVL